MARTKLTLGELITPYGLTLIDNDAEAARRPVVGIHSTDYPHPADLIEPGWVVLTNAGAMRGRPDLQRSTIADLDAVGATALGFGLGAPFKAVPRALRDEARRRGFPLFVVPLEVSFIDMTRDVYQATMADETRSLMRLVNMQRHLMDTLGYDDPEETLLTRLAQFIQAKVAIVNNDGSVLQSAGRVRLGAHAALLNDTPRLIEVDSGRNTIVAVPVARSGARAQRWLVAVTADDPRLAKRAVQMTAPLIAAVTTVERAAQRQERGVRAGLLEEMMHTLDESAGRVLTARARGLSVDLDSGARAVALQPASDEGGEAVIAELEARGTPFLARSVDGVVEVLLVEPDGGLVDDLGARASSPAGVGRRVRSVHDVATSARDARLALAGARAAGRADRVTRYEDLDLDEMVLANVSAERLEPVVQAVLGPLADVPMLDKTLRAYFDHDLDIAATAAALFVHPNTLRYRLRRIEDLLGRPLRAPATIAILHLALRASRMS